MRGSSGLERRFLYVFLLATLSGVAWAEGDERVEIRFDAQDYVHCMSDMRAFLEYARATLGAVLDRDFVRVRTLAEGVRPSLAAARRLKEGVPPPAGNEGGGRFTRVQKILPPEFRSLMYEMRAGVAAIGDEADRQDAEHTLRQLWQVQGVCAACHSTYRLQPVEGLATRLP